MTGASAANTPARCAAASWPQPRAQVRPGSRAARNPGAWISTAASQAAAGSSVQAAARYSRTGGQPRSHAAMYPAAAGTVTGQAATAATASSSHHASLEGLADQPQDDGELQPGPHGHGAASGVNAAAGRSRTTTRAWSPGGSEPAARVTTGRAAGAVR